VGLLDATSGGRALPRGFSCQLLSWRLSSSGFTRGLLGTSHFLSQSLELKTKIFLILNSSFFLKNGNGYLKWRHYPGPVACVYHFRSRAAANLI